MDFASYIYNNFAISSNLNKFQRELTSNNDCIENTQINSQICTENYDENTVALQGGDKMVYYLYCLFYSRIIPINKTVREKL